MAFRLRNIFLISLVTNLLTGCFATIFSGSMQTIQMKVVNGEGNLIEGIRCVVRDSSGTSHSITSNPEAVVIQRGLGLLSIDCKKQVMNNYM